MIAVTTPKDRLRGQLVQRWLFGVVLAALLLVSAVALVGFVWPEDERPASLGLVDDYAVGSVTFFFLVDDALIAPHLHVSRADPDGRVFLVRLESGELRAFVARETLYGGPIVWDPRQGKFLDPSRGSLYEIDGNVRRGPATRALDEYRVEVFDGHVRVELGRLLRGAETTQ